MKNYMNACFDVPGFKLIFRPCFQDECGHGGEHYIGSGEYRCYPPSKDNVAETLKVDVYVFSDAFTVNQICIRYGNEPHQYVSPGTLLDFLYSAFRHHFPKVDTCTLAALVIANKAEIEVRRG